MGFHKGRPLAAIIVFRCCLQAGPLTFAKRQPRPLSSSLTSSPRGLLQWRAFQADRTSLFDRIIGVVGTQIEKQQDDNASLAYWLTNTVTLLHMLQVLNPKP